MLMGAFGWRSLFYVVGGAGIVFGGIWWLLYREPRDHPSANQAELDYIEAGGGLTQRHSERTPLPRRPRKAASNGAPLAAC